MIGDLHCHSKLSDGSTGLDDIVFYAKRAGLDALAITDHDTMSGVPRAEILGRRYGLTVIPGVEISTFDPDTGDGVVVLTTGTPRQADEHGLYALCSQLSADLYARMEEEDA